MKSIHITTGDPEGIGLEIALKALNELGPVRGVRFVLWRALSAKKDMFQLMDGRFQLRTASLSSAEEAKAWLTSDKTAVDKENVLYDMALPETPAKWVEEVARLCMKNPQKESMVTGPLSKTQMQKEGFEERGHTGLLKKTAGVPHVYMCFLGDCFNVVLLTGHVPLKRVRWDGQSLNHCIELCLQFKKSFDIKGEKLCVLGFNPHAGEGGLLGTEETALQEGLGKWPEVEGPLVPDTAFFKKNWKKYFMYICLYHDQGLIPFKMTHGRKSFQLSLGLPWMRVSVSHGTAKDIVGQNRADPESMKRALLWATRHLKD